MGVHLDQEADQVLPYFDTFAEQVDFCVDYRGKLAQVVKATAHWLPLQATSPRPHHSLLP